MWLNPDGSLLFDSFWNNTHKSAVERIGYFVFLKDEVNLIFWNFKVRVPKSKE